jgi:hypothetical protein
MSAITATTAVSQVVNHVAESDPRSATAAAPPADAEVSPEAKTSAAILSGEPLLQPTLANYGSLGTKVNAFA